MSKLIVFEGIDNSGKTSISQEVGKRLMEETGEFWGWSKEPSFSTEEADRLNDETVKGDPIAREILFLESRLRQQPLYRMSNVVLDRYLWTGVAYAKVFSPETFSFVSLLYQNYKIFHKPLLTVFVDTPVEICQSREPGLSLDRLNRIRNAYLETQPLVNGPVLKVSGEGTLEKNVNNVMSLLHKHWFNQIKES